MELSRFLEDYVHLKVMYMLHVTGGQVENAIEYNTYMQ